MTNQNQIELLHGDCLELMKNIPDKSIDMILCDLPYGTTACKWDVIIPFEPLWDAYKRIIKDNGAIVLTASQPFTTKLIASNYAMFKYELIWEKSRQSNFMMVNRQHLKAHENILIFASGKFTYNKQLEEHINNNRQKYAIDTTNRKENGIYGKVKGTVKFNSIETKSPQTIQYFKSEIGLHPTQKPVALMEYLIKTYTNDGDLVLDNCMGSGTTGVACVNLNRRFIGMEKEEKYFEIASKRIADKQDELKLFKVA